jgi:hypothetical protein
MREVELPLEKYNTFFQADVYAISQVAFCLHQEELGSYIKNKRGASRPAVKGMRSAFERSSKQQADAILNTAH